MSYLGGKAKSSQYILDVLNDPLFDGMEYFEPFVGYAHIMRRVRKKMSHTASDSNELLLLLLKAIQNGDALPAVADRAEYERLKIQHKSGHATPTLSHAVAAFTYSFNGKEWGGYTSTYTRRDGRVDDIPKSRFNYYDTLRQNEQFMKARLTCADYRSHAPVNMLVYCDPPYEGTCRYSSTFSSSEFWDTVRAWSSNNIVFVSEYSAPSDFVIVAQRKKLVCLNNNGREKKDALESLYIHESRASDVLNSLKRAQSTR